MIEKEDESDPTCDPRLAALLAVHLVSQILDEACVIADAAKDQDQPWRHIYMLKNLRRGKLTDADDEDILFGASKGDSGVFNENKMDHVANNIVATSTPQKVSSTVMSDDIPTHKAEGSFIGQGDEEMRQNELLKSTSMFINHLFDMSDVERVVICDDTDIIQSNSDSNDLLTQTITKIMESYVNTALGMAYNANIPEDEERTDFCVTEKSSSTEKSAYSFLSDAFAVDVGKNTAFFIDEDAQSHKENDETYKIQIDDKSNEVDEDFEEKEERGDLTAYENAYLSMNRDYDQCSDDDEPVLQDPKGIMLQEVELMTANTSNENDSNASCKDLCIEEQKPKQDLAATSVISAAASGSRKSTLVRRCRTQGARLLACIRGWWRRKIPGKRKEARVLGSVRGLCPLSPEARRRAASLLDNRQLRSPSPSRPVVWKFNTVNEALVNSSRWKDYTFDINPDCD